MHFFIILSHSYFRIKSTVIIRNFVFSYPTSNVNEATRRLFQFYSSLYYERNVKLQNIDQIDDSCDFTPNLHKKAVFESLFHEFDIPFVRIKSFKCED